MDPALVNILKTSTSKYAFVFTMIISDCTSDFFFCFLFFW